MELNLSVLGDKLSEIKRGTNHVCGKRSAVGLATLTLVAIVNCQAQFDFHLTRKKLGLKGQAFEKYGALNKQCATIRSSGHGQWILCCARLGISWFAPFHYFPPPSSDQIQVPGTKPVQNSCPRAPLFVGRFGEFRETFR